jgi:hypothetical protein
VGLTHQACATTSLQSWLFAPRGDGYLVENGQTLKCLALRAGNSRVIVLAPCHESNAEVWLPAWQPSSPEATERPSVASLPRSPLGAAEESTD